MKICSLYGVGYYYIPGTDTCIKIGGYVRLEAYHNDAGGLYSEGTPQGSFTRHGATYAMQARFRMSATFAPRPNTARCARISRSV